jgi:hypothetical protein
MSGQGFPHWTTGLAAITLGLLASTACEPYEAEPRVQSFVLPGAHAALDCTSCHLDEPPYDPILWDVNCISCHDAGSEKQELGDPNGAAWGTTHYTPQSTTTCSNNGGCHSDAHLTWGEALGGCPEVDHSFLPLEGAHGLGCGECHSSASCEDFNGLDLVYNDVPIIDPSDSCMACHENVRPNFHYERPADQRPAGSELRGDCKACHDAVSREGTPVVDQGFFIGFSKHLVPPNAVSVLVPHGTFGGVGYGGEDAALPVEQWVTACADCHPAGEPVTLDPSYQCTDACHAELFGPYGLDAHQGQFQGEDELCLVCHEGAEFMP